MVALAFVAEEVARVADSVPSFGAQLARMFGVLAAMVLALYLAEKALRRLRFGRFVSLERGGPRAERAGRGDERVIEIVERHRIDARRTLLLVRVWDRFVLVGSSENGLQALSGGELDHEALAEWLDGGRAHDVDRVVREGHARGAGREPGARECTGAGGRRHRAGEDPSPDRFDEGDAREGDAGEDGGRDGDVRIADFLEPARARQRDFRGGVR